MALEETWGAHWGVLDEQDLAILDAVQLVPRAPFAAIAAVLGLDPATVARRWTRLNGEGLAWVTAAFGPSQSVAAACIEVQCGPGRNTEVARALAQRTDVVSVQHVSGDHDVFAIVFSAGFAELSQTLLVSLPAISGITRLRSHLVTRWFPQTGHWRLRVLGPTQVQRLQSLVERSDAAAPRTLGPADHALFAQLCRDGRASWSDLGQELGLSARTVQRRVRSMVAGGELDFRCDVAREIAGWPGAVLLWISVPDGRLDEVGTQLARRPDVRTCAALADRRNLLVSVALRSTAGVHRVISELVEDVPDAVIADRNVVLRQAKLYGRVLDDHGRAVRAVPIDPWNVRDDDEIMQIED